MATPYILDSNSSEANSSFTNYQKRVVLLCALIAMLDGFDTQAIAFVAPVIATEWGLQVSAFGPVFGAGLAGLMVGAFIFGPAADRWGRKRVILVTTALFGALTLSTAWATSLPMLLVLRFVAGLGLGGVMPNIIALTSENVPARLRATMVSLMFCGFPLGAVLGGLIAARLIPEAGWQSPFWLGGFLPLALIPALLAWLPNASLPVQSTAPGSTPVARIFSRDYRSHTFLLWIVFFMNLLLLYFLVNWLPSLLRQAGISLDKAIIATVLLNAGGIAGSLVFARLIDRYGPYKILPVAYLAAAGFTTAIGLTTEAGFYPMMAVVMLAGFSVIGAQISINALAAGIYPMEMRATGVGWALGIGRAGSIVGPVVGGVLLAAGFSISTLFGIAAVPALIGGAAVLGLATLAKANARIR
nr:4-hydroxybenzoate transporter [uncultured bacterium]